MRRVFYIDMLKAFAIVLVVFGHVYSVNDNLYYWVYSFHVPLFFCLSGVFFHYGIGIKEYFQKRWHSTIIPFVFFYVLTFLYWVLIEREMRSAAGGVDAQWWRPLLGLLTLSANNNLMPHNNPLWFVPTLITIEIISCCVTRLSKPYRYLVGVLFIPLSVFCAKFLLPFEVSNACYYLLFFLLGKELCTIDANNLKKKSLWLLPLLITVFLLIVFFGALIPITEQVVYEVMRKYLIALFMIAFFVYVAIVSEQYVQRSRLLTSVFSFLGANTLVVLFLHDPLKRAIIYVLSKAMRVTISQIREDFVYSVICTLLVFILLYPIIVLYNKRVRPLLNKI